MAFFTKKTWVARQGTGLNKFSINGATPVTVVNQPDTVTEQGDALSATNLNNLEQRIYDAFDDVADDIHDVIEDIEDGTIVAKKAEQDANGNEITTTYETKADASELKSEIDNNSQRIENLEVAVSGSLVQTNTDATMANTKVITNANEILPWAILKRVGARAVNWNQLVKNGNLATSTDWFPVNSSLIEGKIVSSGGSPWIYQEGIKLVGGHRYLISINLESSVSTANTRIQIYNSSLGYGYLSLNNQLTANTPFAIANLFTLEAGKGGAYTLYIFQDDGATVSANETFKFEIILRDLTLTFGSGNEPTFIADVPSWMLNYTPYNTGTIYDLNPEGFLVRGVNLCDEEFETGSIDNTTGQNVGDGNNVRMKNYNRCEGNQTYFLCSPNDFSIRFYFYDADKNFISSGSERNYLTVSPPNAVYFRIRSTGSYGATYKHDMQFCLNSLPENVKFTYHPYDGRTVETPQIADGHYVNENCYDYVENVIEDGIVKGKKHTIVGSVDLGTLDWVYQDSPLSRFSSTVIDDIKAPVNDGAIANISCGLYLVGSVNGTATIDKTIGAGTSQKLYFKDLSKTGADLVNGKAPWLNGVMLYYEIATESITDCEPIPNIPCENGTTVTAITPQTDLVNAIDVPSTIAYMTKIAS